MDYVYLCVVLFYAHRFISLQNRNSSSRHLERRLLKTVHYQAFITQLSFLKSKKALAIPVTYLILFASLFAMISVTYTFAVAKIGSSGALLRAATAKQNMQILDNAVHSTAWSFGASEVVYMDDCGGVFRTEVSSRNLHLNMAIGESFSDVVFNSLVGRTYYSLQASELDEGFVKGDERAIINQTASTTTQVYIASSSDAKQLILCYRPFVTAAIAGTVNGKPLNLIRINMITLNSSESVTMQGKFYVKVLSENVTVTTNRYEFNQSVSSAAVKSTLGGIQTTITLPISSISEGTVIDVETIVCYIKIQGVEV